MTPTTTDAALRTRLEEMRQIVDEEADAVVRQIYDQRDGPHRVNQLFSALGRDAQAELDKLRCDFPLLEAYFSAPKTLPADADVDRIERGQRFFGVQGPQITLALLCASLPYCYAAERGVQVLYLTARLASDATRRILETAQMLLDVMAPGALDASDGPGFATIRRVRLIHAGVRFLIENEHWRDQRERRLAIRLAKHAGLTPRFQWRSEWGRPLNQEDQLGTLLAFSFVPLRVLQHVGTDFDRGAAEDYIYTWNVIGTLLGIDPQLMPSGYTEAARLSEIILDRNAGKSDAGMYMARALARELRKGIPGRLLDPFADAMIYDLADKRVREALALRSDGWTLRLIRLVRRIIVALHIQPAISATAGSFSDHYGYDVVHWMVRSHRGKQRLTFQLPETLARAWELEPFATSLARPRLINPRRYGFADRAWSAGHDVPSAAERAERLARAGGYAGGSSDVPPPAAS